MKGKTFALLWTAPTALVAAISFVTAQPAGDAQRGRALFESRCIGCHSLDSNRVGPALRGVFGRQSGSAPDFAYSEAVRGAALTWDAENLDRWLSGPEAFLSGQRMGYSVGSAGDRADVIAYLMTLDRPTMPRDARRTGGE